MTTVSRAVFALPDRLAAKASPRLVGKDTEHLALVADTVAEQVSSLTAELGALRQAPAGRGSGALDRDLEIHRLSARLGVLRRFGRELCLGRIVWADGSPPSYIGRIGVVDAAGDPILVDWRAPAAEPFFAATTARPLGLASRRRYRWAADRVVDYWDDAFVVPSPGDEVALDDDSAFIASLGASRSARMRDVLATIAADQDAIIRADSAGALVVDGGPGTGKTVVALHRAAYLLYADPRLAGHRGGVLFIGPNESYLGYVADVLPGLGTDGVRTCTLADLVPEGAGAQPEADPRVARLKASAQFVQAVEPAVGLYEEPPATPLVVETAWADVVLTPDDWREAFLAVDPGTPHNEARDEIWATLLDIAADNGSGDHVPRDALRRALSGHRELRETFQRAWPILNPADLVGDLWAVPAYLRRCAPWLDAEEVRLLKRPEGSAWTVSDLPLLDAMRARLGDPAHSHGRRRREAALSADRAYMDQVVEDLLAADDDPESPLPLLRRASLRQDLLHTDALPEYDRDPLAGPFAHILVDEAQELTDAEWQMVLRRCPSRSITVVGDRAQARHGFAETWQQRLNRVGFDAVNQVTLRINYRTPQEVMDAAEPVIRAVLPDANVPASIRRGGEPVRHAPAAELAAIVTDWLANRPEGTVCVIGVPGFPESERVRSMRPQDVKGLEFDLVVVAGSAAVATGIVGVVDRYVAMTRATRQLVILDQ